jgi:hypothetical protein
MSEFPQNSHPLIQPLEAKYLTMPYAHSPPNGPEAQQLLFQQAFRAGYELADKTAQQQALDAQQLTDLQLFAQTAVRLSHSEKLSPERRQFWQTACETINLVLEKKTQQAMVRNNLVEPAKLHASASTSAQPATISKAEAAPKPDAMIVNAANVLLKSYQKLDAAGRKLFCDTFKNADQRIRLQVLGGATGDLLQFCITVKDLMNDSQLSTQDLAFWHQIYTFITTTLEHRTGKSIMQLMNSASEQAQK